MFFSFIGWLYELTLIKVLYNRVGDPGFLSMPICPIYGTTIMIIYFLIGTPYAPKGVLKRIDRKLWLYLSYFSLVFLAPTVMEFVVGWFFDKVLDMRLWSYKGVPLNIMGYISIPISFLWATAIIIAMQWFFPFVKKNIFKISAITANVLAISLMLLMVGDLIYNVIKIVIVN